MRRAERSRDEAGQVSVLIIGLAAVLLLAIAVVIDASAAYIQRQGLDSLADGAALHGADLGATGEDVYRGGVPDGELELTAARARAAVRDYLADVGAYRRYPGLTAHVVVTDTTVEVRLTAPVDLPLSIPGSPDHPVIGADGAAVVSPEGSSHLMGRAGQRGGLLAGSNDAVLVGQDDGLDAVT